MCKAGSNLGQLLIFFAISAIIWVIYVISSFMAISGIQPISGGINTRLLTSIADINSKAGKEEDEKNWSYYSPTEAKAKFGLTVFLTTAVFCYALHWILSLVLIACSFIVYFYIKKKSKSVTNNMIN